jgi:putative holliday junction resolvase
VDYGRKRMGLALSDEMGLTARPFETMTRTNRQGDMRRLREICRTQGICRVIVGYPLHLTGEAGAMAGEAAGFARRLEKALGIEVELHDERLTTWQARQTMAETKPHRRKIQPIDDVAAAVLLRDYLEQKGVHGRGGSMEKD